MKFIQMNDSDDASFVLCNYDDRVMILLGVRSISRVLSNCLFHCLTKLQISSIVHQYTNFIQARASSFGLVKLCWSVKFVGPVIPKLSTLISCYFVGDQYSSWWYPQYQMKCSSAAIANKVWFCVFSIVLPAVRPCFQISWIFPGFRPKISTPPYRWCWLDVIPLMPWVPLDDSRLCWEGKDGISLPWPKISYTFDNY